MNPLLVRITPFLAARARTGDSSFLTLMLDGGGVLIRLAGGVSAESASSLDVLAKFDRPEEFERFRKSSWPPSFCAMTALTISSAADGRRRGSITAGLALILLDDIAGARSANFSSSSST